MAATILQSVLHDLKTCWKALAATDIAYKIIAFIALTPLIGILFRILVAASGRTVLADEDIVKFLLGPLGWLCLIGVGALWLAIVSLELSALMGVLAARTDEKYFSLIRALQFAAQNAVGVLKVTARLVAVALLISAPFLAVAGVTYVSLLTEFDINFYLQQKPPEFLWAVGIGVVLGVSLAIVLLYFASGWLFALPILLFEDVPPSKALRESRSRAAGHRKRIFICLAVWLLATTIISAIVGGIVGWLGSLIVPRSTQSLTTLALAVGGTLVLLTLASLATNLLSTISFSSLLFHLYLQVGRTETWDPTRVPAPENPSWLKLNLTRTRLAMLAAVGVILALAVGGLALQTVTLEDSAEITAHRGASAGAPENTMAAVRLALEENTDWVEIDVQETADGQVVVFHDSDFKKLADNPLKIWDATMADLAEIDIGSWFDPKFADERVPTLEQVLQECKGKARVNIELKYYGHDEQLEQRVVDIVEALGMDQDIVIMSLKGDAVAKMKKLRPDWRVGRLAAVAVGDLTKEEADFLAVNANMATRRFVQSAHDNEKDVHVWTVNDAVSMSTLLGRGVDNIITDKPGLGKSVLEQRKELSVPERLLIQVAALLGAQQQIAEQ